MHRTMRFPIVLYGRKTCAVTLRVEHTLKAFENRAISIIFDLKGSRFRIMQQVIYIGDIDDLHRLLGCEEKATWHTLQRTDTHRGFLVTKPEGKRPLEGSIRCWENNIKMNHKNIGWESVEWIRTSRHTSQWRILVNMIKQFRLTQNVGYMTG